MGPRPPRLAHRVHALALRELGTTIDLHGGGSDLIFPHHECERAQSEAATGEPFVKHWMHTSMVFLDGQKMSKSLGNLVFVDKLRTEWDPRAIRLAIIDNHYRRDWEWDDTLMPRNTERLRSWKDASRRHRPTRASSTTSRRARRRSRHDRGAGRHRSSPRHAARREPRPRRCWASTCKTPLRGVISV